MSEPKQKIVTLNYERRLYVNLYVACQSRKGDLDNFCAHENMLSQSQYQSMVRFEKLSQSLIFFNAWNL